MTKRMYSRPYMSNEWVRSIDRGVLRDAAKMEREINQGPPYVGDAYWTSATAAAETLGLNGHEIQVARDLIHQVATEEKAAWEAAKEAVDYGFHPTIAKSIIERAMILRSREKWGSSFSKAQGLPEGTKRTHGGREVVKRGGEWVPAEKDKGAAKDEGSKERVAVDERFRSLRQQAKEAGYRVKGKLAEDTTHEHLDKLEAGLKAQAKKDGKPWPGEGGEESPGGAQEPSQAQGKGAGAESPQKAAEGDPGMNPKRLQKTVEWIKEHGTDAKVPGSRSVGHVLQHIDRNSDTRLNMNSLRRTLARGGERYVLHSVDVGDVDHETHGPVRPSGREDLDQPIVINHKGEVIDGRHRVALARAQGITKLPAYMPVQWFADQEGGLEKSLGAACIDLRTGAVLTKAITFDNRKQAVYALRGMYNPDDFRTKPFAMFADQLESGARSPQDIAASVRRAAARQAPENRAHVNQLAAALRSFSPKPQPKGGWQPIPNGKSGGQRRRVAGGFEYRYPNKGSAKAARKEHIKQGRLLLAMAKRLKADGFHDVADHYMRQVRDHMAQAKAAKEARTGPDTAPRDSQVSAVIEAPAAAPEAAEGLTGQAKTQTPEFRSWFGDSKVVDAAGAPEEQHGKVPVKMFHGTPVGGFRSFSKDKDKGYNIFGKGFYFTADREIAEEYTKKDEEDAKAGTTHFVNKAGNKVETLTRAQVKQLLELSGFSVDETPKGKWSGDHEDYGRIGSGPNPNWDYNVLHAVAEASDSKGRVDLDKFLATFWSPGVENPWSASGPRDNPSPMGGVRMVNRIEKVAKVKGVVPEAEVFEVYLAIEKPIDMEAPVPREEFAKYAEFTKQKEIESYERQIKSTEEGIEKAQANAIRYDERAAEMEASDFPEKDQWTVQFREMAQHFRDEVEQKRGYIDGFHTSIAQLKANKEPVVYTYTKALSEFRDPGRDQSDGITWDELVRMKERMRKVEGFQRSPNGMYARDAKGDLIPSGKPMYGILHLTPADQISWGDVHYITTDKHEGMGARSRFTEWARQAGYDGIKHTGGWNIGTREHTVWIAWEPNQIKHVDNVGTFDPSTDDMYKAGGPYIGPRGGKWADPQRTIPWKERSGKQSKIIDKVVQHEEKAEDLNAEGLKLRAAGKTREADRKFKEADAHDQWAAVMRKKFNLPDVSVPVQDVYNMGSPMTGPAVLDESPNTGPTSVDASGAVAIVMDKEAADAAWNSMDALLSDLHDALAQHDTDYINTGKRFNRKAALKALEDLRDETMAKFAEPQVVKVGGLAVETAASSIEQYTADIAAEAFRWRIDALQDKDYPASELRDAGFWRGLNRGKFKFNQAYGFERPQVAKTSAADWERLTEGLQRQLADAAALPESHHALLERSGTRVRTVVHAVFAGAGGPWRGLGWAGEATTDSRTKSPLILLSDQQTRDDMERGTTLSHEVAHILDALTGKALEESMREVVGSRKVESRTSDLIDPDRYSDTHRRYASWMGDPGEWVAEAYRYAYRDGDEMQTDLQSGDLDLEQWRGTVDRLVSEALSAEPRGPKPPKVNVLSEVPAIPELPEGL